MSGVRVTLKDGVTVYDFEDAKFLRALLHGKPGSKPGQDHKGGALDYIVPSFAWLKSGPPGTHVVVEPPQLRYLASSIQTVEAL
jgi:hypothetical protein